ncbi:unnamed protein product [Moneuplotes crassus]|uniref:Uncharacterized protein n=1 Tax=Euplotes crassus TaxID=5936 RepID=A0AAD1UII8_EUPCR|nr:unnamed protein product [Moneuplotes crassus]
MGQCCHSEPKRAGNEIGDKVTGQALFDQILLLEEDTELPGFKELVGGCKEELGEDDGLLFHDPRHKSEFDLVCQGSPSVSQKKVPLIRKSSMYYKKMRTPKCSKKTGSMKPLDFSKIIMPQSPLPSTL